MVVVLLDDAGISATPHISGPRGFGAQPRGVVASGDQQLTERGEPSTGSAYVDNGNAN
jgi:hypothetical protein